MRRDAQCSNDLPAANSAARRPRGADLLAEALAAAGTRRLFTLSGNQIMSVFDASIDAGLDLIHVRHEAAAVHMADAWGRLTEQPGVALVTAGPGFANCLSALYVAQMAESPMILLSGQAPNNQRGRGPFQEMAQAAMARHVAKASWTVSNPRKLVQTIQAAFETAVTGRPGPVHVALPVNVLEANVRAGSDVPTHAASLVSPANPQPIDDRETTAIAEQVLDAVAASKRPLILAGPAMMRHAHRELLATLSESLQVPVVGMESPRGVNDPSLGAFAQVLPEADLIVLLGKKLDFTLQLSGRPAYDDQCRLIQLDADAARIAQKLVHAARQRTWPASGWRQEVQSAISYRPAEWSSHQSSADGPLKPVDVCRDVQRFLDAGDSSVFISDGGEFGQWAQACITAPHRIINGPSGSIGSAIPFALAARLAFPDARIATLLGDGTFGFHALEFDTAVRHRLPFVAVVGNDSTWNAEYQIQLNKYGPERMVGCELLPTRYDLLAQSLGGHGQHISRPTDLAAALDRAHHSALPACVNVSLERTAAPVIRIARR
jgi:acetolactate synthase-1/2/3 large subunit